MLCLAFFYPLPRSFPYITLLYFSSSNILHLKFVSFHSAPRWEIKCGGKEPKSLGKRDKPIQLNTHPATPCPQILLPSRFRPPLHPQASFVILELFYSALNQRLDACSWSEKYELGVEEGWRKWNYRFLYVSSLFLNIPLTVDLCRGRIGWGCFIRILTNNSLLLKDKGERKTNGIFCTICKESSFQK